MKQPSDEIDMKTTAELQIAAPSTKLPCKVLLYGTEGVGKSYLAAQFPKPLFIDTEGSTLRLKPQPARLPDVADYPAFKRQLQSILNEKHEYQTLVIDSIDWLEGWILEYLCKKYQVETKEQILGGYGKWVSVVEEEVEKLLAYLDRICYDKQMNILLIAHSVLDKTTDPTTGEAYRAYATNLSKQVAPLIKQWCEALLFANYRTMFVDKKGTAASHVIGGRDRVLYTTHTAIIDAKNRFGLDDTIPMTIEALAPLFE